MLIGLHGKAGSGKDTVCEFIKEWGTETSYAVRRDAFADRLKLSAARIFFPDITLEAAVDWCNTIKLDGRVGFQQDPSYHAMKITGREFLQRYGTECHRRVFSEDFWVAAVLDRYDAAEILVLTDPRFPNEGAAVREAGGETWEIVRPGQQIAESAHASEVRMPSHLIDDVIMNVGTLDDLRFKVFCMMNKRVAVDAAA